MVALQELSVEQVFGFITRRQSVGLLVEPAPSELQLEQAIEAALTAPDHHRLKPWRYICIQGEQRQAFGELLAECLRKDGVLDAVQLERVKMHPLRAPMLLVCIMNYQAHPKVPEYEQILSCGAAIQNILLTLQAQGYATMWRSGAVAESETLKAALGCDIKDRITGLIYIGTAVKEIPPRAQQSVADYLTAWQGE